MIILDYDSLKYVLSAQGVTEAVQKGLLKAIPPMRLVYGEAQLVASAIKAFSLSKKTIFGSISKRISPYPHGLMPLGDDWQ